MRPGPRCIDLFSGAGGLAEGFRQAGWSILSANDVDLDASKTFRLNFPEASFFEGSISELTARALLEDGRIKRGELDCLIGGPPCQSFSYNNHQRSAKNARAKLFRHYLRIVDALMPKTIVMENVPGMLTIEGGAVIGEIERNLGKLGYQTEVRILYAEDFGVPQTRRRVFIVASRLGDAASLLPSGRYGPSIKPSIEANPLVHRWQPQKGAKAKKLITVWQAISDLPPLQSGGGEQIINSSKQPAKQFRAVAQRRSGRIYNHVCHDLTPILLKRIAHVPEGGSWRDIPRRLLTAGMRRAKLNSHTKRYGRLSRRGLASTLLTKCDPHWGAYIHPTQNRTISVREAARLQGFPDRFRFYGDLVHKHYVQVGNAVPVPLAKALAKSVVHHLTQHAKKNAPQKTRERSAPSSPHVMFLVSPKNPRKKHNK